MSYDTDDESSLVVMTCPYDSDLCNAPATLGDFEVRPLNDAFAGGWRGVLTCAEGHQFVIGQQAIDQ